MRSLHHHRTARKTANVDEATAAPAQRRAAQVGSFPSGVHYVPSAIQRAPAGGEKALPGGLRNGIEALSGISMSDVVVHRQSSKPAQLGAYAYTHGSAIYLAPSQERHLPHEAWHVVQQKQGRVKPTMQMRGGVRFNDDTALEHEADAMGARATRAATSPMASSPLDLCADNPGCIQRQAKLPEPATLEDVIEFLKEVIANNEKISKADQKTINDVINGTGRALNRSLFISYRELYWKARYEEGGVIHDQLFKSSQRAPSSRKPKSNQPRPPKETLEVFSDDESDLSEGDNDPAVLYEEQGTIFQAAIDHSDFYKKKDTINPRNTNMLVLRGKSLIPSSINGKPNVSAKRKRKRKPAESMKKGPLRAMQETVFFGSHLNLAREGDFETGFEPLKKRIKTEESHDDPVWKLAATSRPGFSIRNTESHAEQSHLRSGIWEALKAKLIKQFAASLRSADQPAVSSDDNTSLVTLMLNRSSCRGCALALAAALIQFWEQLAVVTGEELTWREAKAKYGSRLRFVVRFPTIYEYAKEKKGGFANLREILAALHEAGWEIAPIEPHIRGGMDSYRQLVETLTELGIFPDQAKFEFYNAGGHNPTGKEPSSAPSSHPIALPQPSVLRVPQEQLQTYLDDIAPNWAQPFQQVPGNGAQQLPNPGFMAHQIQPEHQELAMPIVLGEEENQVLAPHDLQVSPNGGQGALCFVYAVLMGLTGESEQAIAPMAQYVATQAGAVGGWITADSLVAANVVAQIEQIYGENIDVVAIQHGQDLTMIAGRAGHLGARTVVIRQTPGHYDAYIPE